MSKELLALEDIILYLNANEPKGLYCENIETIKQALLELKSIKEANPSEALKCLDDLYCEPVDYRSNDKANDYETIKQALLKAEKEHKALEIIKEKLVDVFKLYNCKTVEEYNQAQYRDCMLTKEEFNLLKEVLE